MEDTTETQAIRIHMRDMNMYSRKEHRNEKLDAVRMGLGKIKTEIHELDTIGVQDVLGLAGRIKRRRQADENDLLRLSRAFLQNGDNITAFINTTGALNVIVKELTGTEMDVQILACECLCNLSLGPEVACVKVALAASSYLLTFLESTCHRLQITALWTITNLCAADGSDAAKVLISQKIVPKLLSLLINTTNSIEITRETYKALNVLFHKHSPLISADMDANKLVTTLLQMLQTNPKNDWGTAEVLYRTLEAYDYQIKPNLSLDILRWLTESIVRDTSIKVTDEEETKPRIVRKCVYSMRVIGNLVVDSVVCMLTMKGLLCKHFSLFYAMLAMDDVLTRDIMWVFGMIREGYEIQMEIPNSIRSGVTL